MKLYNKIFLVVTIIGLVDALYLTYIKLSNTTAGCLPGVGNCEVVNTSVYSQVFGIPIAIFGALAYIALLAILLFEDRLPFLEENAAKQLDIPPEQCVVVEDAAAGIEDCREALRLWSKSGVGKDCKCLPDNRNGVACG